MIKTLLLATAMTPLPLGAMAQTDVVTCRTYSVLLQGNYTFTSMASFQPGGHQLKGPSLASLEVTSSDPNAGLGITCDTSRLTISFFGDPKTPWTVKAANIEVKKFLPF